MDQSAMGGSDPSATPQDESQEQYSVTITSNGDGTYTVASSDSDESQDEPGQPASGSQTAKSCQEACQIAEQMLSEEGQEDQGEGDAPIPADQQKAVWDQMAAKRDQSR